MRIELQRTIFKHCDCCQKKWETNKNWMVKLVISNNNDQFRCSSGRSFSWPFTLIFPWRKRVTYNQVGILSQLKNITLIKQSIRKRSRTNFCKDNNQVFKHYGKASKRELTIRWIILWKSCLEFRCITTLFCVSIWRFFVLFPDQLTIIDEARKAHSAEQRKCIMKQDHQKAQRPRQNRFCREDCLFCFILIF